MTALTYRGDHFAILVCFLVVVMVPTSSSAAGSCPSDTGGYVQMAQDGMLTVHSGPGEGNIQLPDRSLRPQDHGYAGFVELVGGIRAGERKPVLRYDGWVVMNDDRSLTAQVVGARQDGVISEPKSRIVTPDEPYYRWLIAKVGALLPGQGKGFCNG